MYYKILYNQAGNNIQPINGKKKGEKALFFQEHIIIYNEHIIIYKER